MLTAITRPPGEGFSRCLLTFMDREPIDLDRARTQHAAYRAVLKELGAELVTLEPDDDLADAVFLEDNAVVLPEVVVMCNMANPARAPEVDSAEEAISDCVKNSREFRRIVSPGTLEGGDTFRVGRTIFTGLSTRTNEEGVRQLRALLEPFDYRVHAVPVTGCLHLSTGACHLGEGVVLANPKWVDADAIKAAGEPGLRVVSVAKDEPWAANNMRVGDTIVMHAGHPKTKAIVESHGFKVRTVDISEFMKAEAGLTCMRLLFDSAPVRTKKGDTAKDRVAPSFRMTS